jgi:hypothetical protein
MHGTDNDGQPDAICVVCASRHLTSVPIYFVIEGREIVRHILIYLCIPSAQRTFSTLQALDMRTLTVVIASWDVSGHSDILLQWAQKLFRHVPDTLRVLRILLPIMELCCGTACSVSPLLCRHP